MAKFDISGSASRQTGLSQQDRNNAIRMEFEPYSKPPQQPPEQTARIEPMSEYVKPPTAPEQQPSGALPLPLQTVEWEAARINKVILLSTSCQLVIWVENTR